MFSFNRYCNLIVDDLRTNARSQFVGLLAALGVIVALTTMHLIANDGYDNDTSILYEISLFTFSLFGIAVFGGTSVFKVLKNKPDRITYLMRPATNLEKYLSRVTIFSVIFPLVFIVGIIIIDLLRCAFVPVFFHYNPANVHTILNPMYWESIECIVVGFTILVLQSTFVLGSAIWPKKGLIYTIIALFAIGFFTFWWSILIANIFIDPTMEYGWEFFEKIKHSSPTNVANLFATLYIIGASITCIVNYIIAYYRFKEIEIIQRW